MKFFLIISLQLITISCLAQSAQVVRLNDLQNLINTKDDKIQVINFWATWCAPCVKELPLFEKLNAEGRADIEVALVSMDLDLDPDRQKVERFIARKNLQSKVLLLDEKDPSSWIDKIDKQWSGALPATLIINQRTGKRIFVGKALADGDLERYLNQIKNN